MTRSNDLSLLKAMLIWVIGNAAKELAIQSYKVSPNYVGPLLCKLLDRIDHELPAGNIKESSLNDLSTKFSCLP